MAAVTLPATFDALTPEWLTSALRRNGHLDGATVRSVQYEPVGQGVGILCQLARLTLDYDGDATEAPRSLVAKIPSTDPQTRAMVSVFRFYEREVRFYTELAGDLSVATPRRYAGDFDPDTGDFILLLEDLTARRLGDQLAGSSLDDAELTIRELARLHAAWWNHPRLDAIGWMPDSSDPINKAGVAMYPQAWPIFMERVGQSLPAAMQRTGERLGAEVGAILDRFVTGPRTICHGDPRAENLFFAANPGDPALTLIDWQISVKAAGTYDLGYFMSQSLDTEVRRAHEQDLLKLYHSLLCEGGVTGYSFDDMMEHYRWTVLFCFAYPVMAAGFGDLSNERGYQLATTMMNRSAAAIIDWDAGALLEG